MKRDERNNCNPMVRVRGRSRRASGPPCGCIFGRVFSPLFASPALMSSATASASKSNPALPRLRSVKPLSDHQSSLLRTRSRLRAPPELQVPASYYDHQTSSSEVEVKAKVSWATATDEPDEQEASSALQERPRPRLEKKTKKKPRSYVLAEDSDSLEDACARLKAHPKFRPNKHHYGFSLPPSLRETARCNDGSWYKFFWNPCRAFEAVSFTSGRGAVNKVVTDPGKWLFYLYSGGDAPTPEMYAKRKPELKTRPKEFIRDKVIGHGLGWNKDRADARSGADVLAFQEFQKVLLPYCSSDKWIGDADEADWRVNRRSGGHVDKNVRFHGSRIVKAVATYVRDAVARTKGLGPSSDHHEISGPGISEAVLSGTSAGGAGAHLNACAVFHVMHSQNTQTKATSRISSIKWKRQLEDKNHEIHRRRWQKLPLKKFGILIGSAWYVRGPSTDKLRRYHNEYNFVGGERNPEGQRWNGLEMDYQVGFGVWKPNIADACGRAGGRRFGDYNATEGWKCFFPHTHARYFLPDANNFVCGLELMPDDPVVIRPFFAAHGYDSYLKGRGDGGGASHHHLGHLRGRGKQYLQELLDVIARTPASDSFGFFVSASFGHVLMDVGRHNAVMRAKVHGTLLNEVLKRWWSYEWKNESSFPSASSNGRNSSNLAEVWKAKGQYANSCIWGETDKCVALAGGKLKGSNPTFGAHNGRGGFNDGTEQWLEALQEANEKAEAVQKQEEWNQVETKKQMRKDLAKQIDEAKKKSEEEWRKHWAIPIIHEDEKAIGAARSTSTSTSTPHPHPHAHPHPHPHDRQFWRTGEETKGSCC